MTRARITLTDVAFGGEALGRLDGKVVFVPYALPGEEVLLDLVEQRRDFARGEVARVLRRSEQRAAPPCPYFGRCGGCQWQHASYPAQLEIKRQIVVQQLARIGRFPDADDLVRPTIGMLSPWEYRNQVRFSFGRRFGELGFTRWRSHRLLRIDHCYLAHPRINGVLYQLQGRLAGERLHQVVVRVGANTGDLLIAPRLPIEDPPSGQSHLEEELLGRRFRIAAPSFFQVNTRRERRPLPAGHRPGDWLPPLPADGLSMAELLALLVLDGVAPQGDELVIDAYAGVGTFGVLLAPRVRRVIAVEESPVAVQDARHNTRDLPNVEVRAGKAEDLLPQLDVRPDAVVLDPARVGCAPPVLAALIAARPRRIVYVSCDPATLARDLRVLGDGGFRLERVQPLDMFPQTYHVESVALLNG